jgi:regulator of protease activity HflC (stomatin/prohibitin superfamily)
VWGLIGTVFATLLWGFVACGFFTLQPNMSAVLLLFGAYKGTNREPGFRWANPLLQKVKVSLRQHNLNGDKLKVNDKRGNPIEIAVVVVWRVEDTAQACFDVQDYRQYVEVQSEAAVRHLATRYPYDTIEQDEQSLRGSLDEVSAALKDELSDKLRDAGVVVDDARISHLAYASRSPAQCSAASRPRLSSRPARGSSKARWAWSRWRSRSWTSTTPCSSTRSAKPRW